MSQMDKELESIIKSVRQGFAGITTLEDYIAKKQDEAKVHLICLIMSEPHKMPESVEQLFINELGYEKFRAMKDAAEATEKALKSWT